MRAYLRLPFGLVLFTIAAAPVEAQDEFETLLQAAAQGHVGPQYNLGVAYDTGAGVLRDYAEAARWYGMAAAEQGLVEARDALERVEARMAAEQGSPEWQFLLGYTRWTGRTPDGETTLKDHEEAVMWFRLAADQDFADAQLYLGLAYQTGEGTKQKTYEADYDGATPEQVAEALLRYNPDKENSKNSERWL